MSSVRNKAEELSILLATPPSSSLNPLGRKSESNEFIGLVFNSGLESAFTITFSPWKQASTKVRKSRSKSCMAELEAFGGTGGHSLIPETITRSERQSKWLSSWQKKQQWKGWVGRRSLYLPASGVPSCSLPVIRDFQPTAHGSPHPYSSDRDTTPITRHSSPEKRHFEFLSQDQGNVVNYGHNSILGGLMLKN